VFAGLGLLEGHKPLSTKPAAANPRYDCTLVDIHSHVLHGMDDGAKTLDDSLAMLQLAVESGTTDLVATPHANGEYKYDPERIAGQIAELQSTVQGLKLYKGCDFHLSYDNIEDAIAHPRKYTINNNRYLLVEFPEMLIFNNTGELFYRLQDAGMTPIITHPERNELLRQRLEEIATWVRDGSYVQVTAGSLLGRFGRRAAEFSQTLLEQNLVHFIASDGHDLVHRPPSMKEAHVWLAGKYGAELADAVCIHNPKAALEGGRVSLPVPRKGPQSRKWYQMWRSAGS